MCAWISIQFINAVSPKSLYASYGPRDEEPRHRSSGDAGAGEISESPSGAVRALTQGSFAMGFEYFCRSTEYFEHRIKAGQRKAMAYPPREFTQTRTCVPLLPDSVAFTYSCRCAQLSSSGQFLVPPKIVHETICGTAAAAWQAFVWDRRRPGPYQ
jgi:hypothetical protein